MNKLQLQIQEIDNGFLVQLPGITINGQTAKDPSSTFCPDLEDVVVTLNQVWPRRVKKLEIVK